jgi:hypothetical protein
MAPAPVEAEEEAGQGAPSKRQGLIMREGEARIEGRRTSCSPMTLASGEQGKGMVLSKVATPRS